jgi:hypothetical protein
MTIVYPKNALSSFRRVNRATCFVLMPFAREFDKVYRLIRDTLQSPDMNIICTRADDFKDSNILQTILRSIAQSEYVLADLTGANPNVFYETGIAHSVKEPEKVFIITQSLNDVPFDLRQLRCSIYATSPIGMKNLKAELISTFSAASKDSYRFRVHQGRSFRFGKKLVGRDRNLFEILVECRYVGRDAVKLNLRYSEFSLDQSMNTPESQLCFLSHEQPSQRLEYVPWVLHLADVGDHEALLVLEKAT